MKSLAARLVTRIVLSQAAVVLVAAASGMIYSSRVLQSGFDVALRGKADAVLAAVQGPEHTSDPLRFNANVITAPSLDDFAVLDRSGRIVAQSAHWPPPLVLTGSGSTWDTYRNGIHYRVMALRNTPILDLEEGVPGPPERVTVFYLTPRTALDQRIAEATLTILFASMAVLMAAGLLTWLAVRRSLRPLRLLAHAAESVTPTHWTFACPPPVHDTSELHPVAQSLDTLVRRLQQAFDREREFNADIAHELKTAVAILKSSLQRVELTLGTTAFTAPLEDVERIERLVANMLQLAQLEGQTPQTAPEVSAVLQETCRTAIDRFAAHASVEVRDETTTPLQVMADPHQLESLWSNLIENALRYSGDNGLVSLRIVQQDSAVCVEVRDNGPGFEPADLPRVFERFFRSDSSRARVSGGFGLGLAISRAIVQRAGGTISARNDNGAVVTVQLPVRMQPLTVGSSAPILSRT
jgi:signal transduction histidine kinase